METKEKKMEYSFDAKDKKLGRLATEIAVVLMGKDSPDFTKHQVADVKVIVSNVSLLDLGDKKRAVSKYKTFSGYPSGLKVETANQIIKKHGFSEILRIAVRGMLPKNKLRDRMLKNLEIND